MLPFLEAAYGLDRGQEELRGDGEGRKAGGHRDHGGEGLTAQGGQKGQVQIRVLDGGK